MKTLSRTDLIKENKRTRLFFNLVSFVFPIIDYNLFPEYRRALRKLDFPPHLSVLDLASGTGILAGAFAERGHPVKGLDFAIRLQRRAKRRFPQINFELFDLMNLHTIEDASYDLVSMGYFLHGVHPAFRQEVLNHARRISKTGVIVFDYCCPGNWFVRFIEWLEGPYYPDFVSGNRQEDFARAGLSIEKELHLSDYGNCWFLTPKKQEHG